MPSINDFEKKQKDKASSVDSEAQEPNETPKAKRRPGRETGSESVMSTSGSSEEVVRVVDVEEEVVMSAEPTPTEAEEFEQREPKKEKIEVHFYGSELLRARFPKPFEVMDFVATDWVRGGKFEGLPLGHPLAQYFAAKGLQKVKEVYESPALSVVKEKLGIQKNNEN